MFHLKLWFPMVLAFYCTSLSLRCISKGIKMGKLCCYLKLLYIIAACTSLASSMR